MPETHHQSLQIKAEKSEEYKQIFADGAYTILGQESGTIIFFSDSIDPQTNEDGLLKIDTVNRNFLIEIRMSPITYENLINSMIERRENLKNTKKPSE